MTATRTLYAWPNPTRTPSTRRRTDPRDGDEERRTPTRKAVCAATRVESTGRGSRFETFTADGQAHISGPPPIGEPWSEGCDPD